MRPNPAPLLALLTAACAGGAGGEEAGGPTVPLTTTTPPPDPTTTTTAPDPTPPAPGTTDDPTTTTTTATTATTDSPAPDLPDAPAGECRSITAWTTSAPFVADADHVSHPLPSFARAGAYYVHTMKKDASDRALMFAALTPDGALGPWQVATPDHGGGPHGFTAITVGDDAYHFRNGHIARYVFAPDGTVPGDVELLEDSPDTAFGGNKYVWDTAVHLPLPAGAQVLHLGGFSFTGYTYRPDVYRSPVPLAPSFTDTGLDHPSGERPGKSVFTLTGDGGWIYTGRGDGPALWRGDIDAGGALLGWTALPDLPAGTDNGRGDLFIAGRTLFTVRGAAVFHADLGPTGDPGPWIPDASLPGPQIDVHWGEGHLEGAAYAVLDDRVHLTGPTQVYSADLELRACE
jgi:hypothetical protein